MAVSPYAEPQTGCSIEKFERIARRYRTMKTKAENRTSPGRRTLSDAMRAVLVKNPAPTVRTNAPGPEPAGCKSRSAPSLILFRVSQVLFERVLVNDDF
ncbi:hypothetical protein MDOR_38680 [Mycolicibacterium doricum]|uniref:Uncharacterized protein n=1 Tax=Mycolicibacterium doricum TaxID=126673 RepID=A0A7I7VWM0_9MYCO|nr:hypothetical protein MDOR_38680 [Mycolicibacterium doricum]